MSQHDSKLQLDNKIIAVSIIARGNNDVRIDIRQLYTTDDGRDLPSTRGVAIPAHHIDRIIAALEQVKAGMISDGYLIPRKSFKLRREDESGSISGISVSESIVSSVDYDINRCVYPIGNW